MTFEVMSEIAHKMALPDELGRREYARFQMEVAIDFQSEHNFYTGLTQNISEGGLFIATNQIKPIGSRVRVRFTLPGSLRAIDVDTEVRWVREITALQRFDGAQGIGLRFLNLAPDAAQAIKGFLASRDSIFYDD